MRFENYLTEKWFDTTKYSNEEIFKNPSKRDLKEINSQYGFRVFIDLKKKNVYIASGEIFHKSMLDTSDKLKNELKMDWYAYWSGEDKTNDYLIMGDCNEYLRYFNSDSLTDLAETGYSDNAYKHLENLLEWDYKWLAKYGFKPDEVYRTVERAMERMAERLQRYG